MQFSSDTRIWLCAVFVCYSNLLTVTPSCGPSKLSHWSRDLTFDDVEITDYVIPSVSGVRTEWDCIWDCKQNPICVSYSYNLDGTCRLHSVRFKNGASSLPMTGWRHYYSEIGRCPTEDGYVLLSSVNVCFKAFNEKKPIHGARVICSQSGDRLIFLDTAEKNTAVCDYIDNNLVSDVYYIGLNDIQTEGQYVWDNGDVATFLKWMSGEPNSYGGNEDCALVKTSIGSFLDFSCTRSRKFICEKVL
ncbi:mannose-binding protein C-like [Gigantopelta aegis]|uniref:mannose-binding protein C-like n=1 Tax=Gigantopelta aegis TaxID=1735272 RepID=UPI001B88D5CA|nr:mannose-binding protein C-like [Gigantopelta aegis]